jgi:predicted ABC-type ATPase
MPGKPQLHVFAGPNGSGKSTIISDLRKKLDLGVYINADDLHKELLSKSLLN